jgi:hypothetical protein
MGIYELSHEKYIFNVFSCGPVIVTYFEREDSNSVENEAVAATGLRPLAGSPAHHDICKKK